MATQVSLNDLSNWLASQPDNTPQTPYEIEVTGFGSSSDKNKFRNSLLNNPSKYVDLSSMTLYKYLTTYSLFFDCTSLVKPPKFNSEGDNSCYRMFEGCTNLIEIPDFTDITSSFDASRCFYGCTSLTTVSLSLEKIGWADSMFSDCTSLTQVVINFPNSTNLSSAFAGCTSLLSCTINAPQNTNLSYCFKGCANLTTVDITSGDVNYGRQAFYYCSSLSSVILNVNSFNEMRETFAGCTSLTSTPTLPDSVSTMENTFQDCTSLQTITNIPAKVESLIYTFYNCRALTTIPSLKDLNVSTLASTFSGCSSLIIAPELPKQVKNIDRCFSGCRSLEYVSNVPKSVETMGWCFFNCSNLVTIDNFSVPITVLQDSEKAESCFKNCSSLTSVNVTYDESDDWHVYRLKFGSGNISGKVYDKTKTATIIASRQISGTDLKLPVLSDELLFSNSISDSDLDALIEDVLTYKYTYTGDSTSVINPKHRSFVLWADDEDRVVTNLSFPADVSHASGVLPVANGGTGQTTLALARNAMGLGNTTGALPVANGGTGQTTLALARNAMGLGNTTGALPVANGGTGVTSQGDINKAIVGAMTEGSSDVTDGTMFVCSYASDNGYSETGYVNVSYKRKFSKVCNYIKSKWTYRTEGSTTKIKININSTTAYMICFTVTLYQGYRATKVMISGYNYGGDHWYEPEVRLLGDSNGTETLTVYFGYDAVNKLWVGFDGGNYTGIVISDVVNGYKAVENYHNLFTISNVSSLTTTQVTFTAYSKAYQAITALEASSCTGNSATATTADTVDEYHADVTSAKNLIRVTRGSDCGATKVGYYAGMTQINVDGSSKWWHILSMDWSGSTDNPTDWVSQLLLPTRQTGVPKYRRNNASGTAIGSSTWHDFITDENNETMPGLYTGSGGQQNPQYIGKGKVRFNMMNTTINGDSTYKNFLLMDCYTGFDAGGATAIGVSRTQNKAFIMSSDAGTSPNRPTTWARTAELISTANIGSQSVSNASKLSNISVTTTTPTSADSGNCWAYVTKSKFTTTKGYIVYSNGLKIQWGTVARGSDLAKGGTWTSEVTMDNAYTNKNYRLFLTVGTDDTSSAWDDFGEEIGVRQNASNYQKFEFTYYNRNSSAAAKSPYMNWLAIGY